VTMIRTTALALMVALSLTAAEAAGPIPAPHAVEAARGATLVQMSPQERRRILRERLRDERAENRELREALVLAQEEILEQDAIIAALQREVRQLRGENRPPRVARLEERVDRLEERLARRTAQVERLQERRDDLRQRLERRNARVEELQERLAAQRDRGPGPRVGDLRDRLAESEEALAVARAELQRSEQQVENLRGVTQNLRQQIRGQEARTADLERRLNARVAQVRRLESELAELRERAR